MHNALEHQASKPRGPLEESFQYCRGHSMPEDDITQRAGGTDRCEKSMFLGAKI